MDYYNFFIDKGLVDIKSFFLYMQNEFEYGFIDKYGKRHYGINNAKTYRLQSPDELLLNHIGICWDMVELYRCFFETMTSFKYETYYLFYDDNKGCPSHSILAFYDDNKVYWFEPMFNDKECFYSGIHEYNNIIELLNDFKNKFVEYALIKKFIDINYKSSNIKIYQYEKPRSHINGYEMRNHIDSSKFINCFVD